MHGDFGGGKDLAVKVLWGDGTIFVGALAITLEWGSWVRLAPWDPRRKAVLGLLVILARALLSLYFDVFGVEVFTSVIVFRQRWISQR